MTINIKELLTLNLQLFAEGGDGGTGAEGTAGSGVATTPKGVKSNPLADVKYGIQPEESVQNANAQVTDESAVDLNAEFEELIKGKYKDQYGKKTQETVQNRLKSSKETVDKYNALIPTLEMLGKKYGVDPTDIKALNNAIDEDDSFYEEEALKLGMTVEDLKYRRSIEKENAELKRQMNENETRKRASELYSTWMNQAATVKTVYPSFNLDAELQNPKFVDLLRSNIDVRTAYEVIHRDEIMPAAMQFTAKTVEQKLTNKIIANGSRPIENGNSSQSASLTKSNVSQLSNADLDEINRRIARGEKISFG
jgi:hypothetical protein